MTLWQLLLKSWPKRLRRRVGEEVVETLRLREEDTRRQGRSLFWFRVRESADLLKTACKSRGGGRKEGAMIGKGWRTDVKFAWRGLWRRPLWTTAVAATLALGIGSAAAVFSVLEAVLLEPLPYPEAERLVRISELSYDGRGRSVAWLNYRDWKEMAEGVEEMGAYAGWSFTMRGREAPQRLAGALVSRGLFEVLGVQPLRGRLFNEKEYEPGASRVVLVSEGFWRRQMGESQVIGRTLELDGSPVEVVGVLPAEFNIPSQATQVWTPIRQWLGSNDLENRGSHPGIAVLARLRGDASFSGLRAEMDAIAQRLAERYPETNKDSGIRLWRLRDYYVGDGRRTVMLLAAAVGFVLLIACANVANLLLARGESRRREFSLRSALGAGRGRLVRLLMTESLLLACLGGVAGLGVAAAGIELIQSFFASRVGLFRLGQASLDPSVLAFATAVTLASGALFGMSPIFYALRADLLTGLRGTGARGSSASRSRLRNGLVVAEVALSLLLLAGAGLMLRTLNGLLAADPGFASKGVLTARVELSGPEHGFGSAATGAFFRRLMEQVRALPGVEAAGGVTPLPLSGYGRQWGVYFPDSPVASPEERVRADVFFTWPGYFEAMGIPLLSGRVLDERDRPDSEPVVVIDRSMAERYFPNQDAVGRTLQTGGGSERRIVGVVGHVKNYGVKRETRVQMYVSTLQSPFPLLTLTVRAQGDPLALAPAIREAVRRIDKQQLLHRVRPMTDFVERSASQERVLAVLLGLFAGAALLLAAVGIYGVISYAVSRRTREIGVRLSLGASRLSIFRLILSRGVGLAALGVLLGLLASIPLAGVLTGLLYATAPTDPRVLLTVCATLIGVATAACALPARRATRVDPVDALRAE